MSKTEEVRQMEEVPAMQEAMQGRCPVCGSTMEAQQVDQEAVHAQLMPYLELLRAVPELKQAKELPREVLEQIVQGETPLNAYRAYQNQQLRAQLEAMKRGRAAPGSAVGYALGEHQDSFSAGFDEGFLY